MSTKVTNGEYYDYELKSWVVQCGSTRVPIRKLDKNNQPIPPSGREREQTKTAVSRPQAAAGGEGNQK